MTIADAVLYGLFAALDRAYGLVEEGPAWLLPALMLLAFTIVGGLE